MIGALAVLGATVLALTSNIFGVASLIWPKVTVDATSFGDGTNASAISFVVRNGNNYPLENVAITLGLCKLDFRPVVIKGNCTNRSAVRIAPPTWTGHRLAADEAWAVDLREAFDSYGSNWRLSEADIIIAVAFQQWILPATTREKHARFVIKRSNDGRPYWAPMPME